ncbi:type II toxin-antitoxin system MqsA family antitoxin [bacterium]|nr:type II toxin-antitoxin system MqsA family antitoxin [bacterium]
MKCLVCKRGETAPGEVTVTLERGASTVIIRNVPADVCDNCGEFYLAEAVTRKLTETAEAAVQRGAEVEILRYAARSPDPQVDVGLR